MATIWLKGRKQKKVRVRMDNINKRSEPSFTSTNDCRCFVSGYDLTNGELSELVLDSNQCPMHSYSKDTDGINYIKREINE